MNKNINHLQKAGLGLLAIGLIFFTIIPFLGSYQLTEEAIKSSVKEEHLEVIAAELEPMLGRHYNSNIAFIGDFKHHFNTYNEEVKSEEREGEIIWDDYSFTITKASTIGWVPENKLLLLFASVGLGV